MIDKNSFNRLAMTIILCLGFISAMLITERNLLAEPKPKQEQGKEAKPVKVPKSWTPLSKKGDIWVDLKGKVVIADGEVCLRKGFLEMFACPRGTKEHESVVAIYSKASLVHAGLLAIGTKPGSPVKFSPKYVPAKGMIVDISIQWKDKQGEAQEIKAQQWVRSQVTRKAMKHSWVFVGSGFWTDESDGTRYYHGDAGDFICVSNFTTATLDLPVESSQAANDLQYEAFTEHIPAKGTKIRLLFKPRFPKAKKPDTKENQSSK